MKLIRLIGLLLILTGLAIPISSKVDENIAENKQLEIVKEKLEAEEKEYFAILEITDINLKKELFPLTSANNNVDKNLFVVKESIWPGNNRSNVIIAGHSGNGKNAYFKDLYRLQVGANLKLYYNNFIYTYEVKNIELQDKTGTLYLSNNYQDMITLITCTKNDKKHQTIYYAELKTTEKM